MEFHVETCHKAAFVGVIMDTPFDCPLDLSGSNFTQAASICSSEEERGKCCRYINALIVVSIARYANLTSYLGVTSDLYQICLTAISETLQLYGVTRNAATFCGLGSKIAVNYECKGRTTVTQMPQYPKFVDVTQNCKLKLSAERDCKKCLNAGIPYQRNLVGAVDNMTLSTCRDATLLHFLAKLIMQQPLILQAASLGVGIAVIAITVVILGILIFLIHRKSRELDDSEITDKASSKAFSQPPRKFPEGPLSVFRKFRYEEMERAPDNFKTIIGQGGFGTVYKAQLSDGSVVAVKRMDKTSEQAEDYFCREIELLARLHHRHLVTLRGFCVEKCERFLMYEYVANGSLKNHLHTPGRIPLSWRTRFQIAIDVANALEYLYFYCDPPLCHRDIKSSNILLDENFVAKVADFGLAHASKDGSICFEPVNTEIRGTPGYMDPEYAVTQELTERSDVYSYGVVLLELITSRRAIQDNKNLVEWSQVFMSSELMLPQLVDPRIGDSFDFDQLQTIVTIVRWCTQREGRTRPSIKQVLRLPYECSDPMRSGFVEAVENEEYEGSEGKGRRRSRGKMHSGDARCLASSSSTSRSYCSRSFLLEPGSPVSFSFTFYLMP
ncbi:Non-specific serine/threonine protein kinase [Bertholletia excelsa]